MPERWERELRKLRGVEPNERRIRERATRGPSSDRKPRMNALVAGIVAGAVAVAGIAALWQLDRNPDGIGNTRAELPTLVVTFQSGQMIANQPDEQIQRVDTTIVYGDAREENFTSTVPVGAHVDWVGVEDLTRFVPGPTVGSDIEFTADGENARVLVGSPSHWPDLDRFTPMDRLPDDPGLYVLVFEADYPEGTARTARTVLLVDPGVVQLVATQGGDVGAARAHAYIDGRGKAAFLSQSEFAEGDFGTSTRRERPDFPPGAWLEVPVAAPLGLASDATDATIGSFANFDEFDPDAMTELGDPGWVIEGPPARRLLAVEVTWRSDRTQGVKGGTFERALFFFPLEVVTEPETAPAPVETPTPGPVGAETVVVDIRRSSEETGDPEAIARFGSQEQWMCPDGWSVVNPDGTTDEILFNCGQNDVFQAPVGTPIEVTGDFATLSVSVGVTGNRLPGTGEAVPPIEPGTIITLGYEVTWEDGSEASFWLLLTVQDTEPAPVEPSIVVWIYGLGERSTEVPIITMTYAGETKRGCTEGFEWTLPDGTRIDEAAGGDGSLPLCSPDPLFRVPPGIPITVEVPTASEVFVTRTTTPLYGGLDGFGASVRWPGGGAGDFTVTFEVMGSPSDRDIQLDCAEEDRITFTTPDGPRILPGGSAYIRGNMEGFQQTDVIEQMIREPSGTTEWDGTWQVSREGSVIAAVEFGSLRGTACRGSGIGSV